MNDFSDQQNVDDVCLPCQQANQFYCDMPQALQDRARIRGLVNGEETPVLPISQTYLLLNTPAETTGELAIEVRGQHVPLIHDIAEAGSVNRAEDLKVLVGAETPEEALVSVSRDSRIDHAKRLLRTSGRIGAPLTKQARIEEIEAQQRAGIADADAETELWNIIRDIEDQTGEYFIMPVPRDMIVIQMEHPLPPGSYDIDTASETILDKIGNTLLSPFDENFETLLALLGEGKDLAVSNLPGAILELVGAMVVLDDISTQEMGDILRQGGGASRYSGGLVGELRRNPAARAAFKREFINALLKQKVVRIQMFPSGHTVMAFEGKARVRTAYGRITLRSKYRTSFFEASARLSGGKVLSVAGSAFKGLALIGVGLIVINEVVDFVGAENERDWTDLFVGLGFEMAKMVLSSILGAAFAGALVAAGLITGTFWVVIAIGALASMAIGVIIDVQAEQRRVKSNIQNSVNDLQARDRQGQAVNWAQ